MKKPFVACHMLASLDGKIDGAFFDAEQTLPAIKIYGELRGHYDPQATIYGTTTMLGGFADGYADIAETPTMDSAASAENSANDSAAQTSVSSSAAGQRDFINPQGKATGSFIVSLDPAGSLAFSSDTIKKKGRPAAHVIQVLTQRASSSYTAYLQKKGVSYLFAGREQIDCGLLIDKLAEHFDTERIMIAGGGITNQSFLNEGLIDELSLVIAPMIDGNASSAALFRQPDFLASAGPAAFHLIDAKSPAKDILWLRYGR